jgi:hypothetical protein
MLGQVPAFTDMLYIHIYICTYIDTYVHTYIHNTHIHTYTYIHTYIHVYIYTNISTYIHTVYTYICTYVHTYIHTYIIHTYIHIPHCTLFLLKFYHSRISLYFTFQVTNKVCNPYQNDGQLNRIISVLKTCLLYVLRNGEPRFFHPCSQSQSKSTTQTSLLAIVIFRV